MIFLEVDFFIKSGGRRKKLRGLDLDFCKIRVSEIKRALGESEKIAHQNLQKALLRSRKMNPDHEKWV